MKTGDIFWAKRPGEVAHIYKFVELNPNFSMDEGYITLYDLTTGERINVSIFWFKERELEICD